MRTVLSKPVRDVFNAALGSSDPVHAFSEAVREMLRQSGMTRGKLLDALEAYRAVLTESGRDQDEDAVLEVMDFLVGWASPHKKIRGRDIGTPPSSSGSGDADGELVMNVSPSVTNVAVPMALISYVFPGTAAGVWTDRPQAALWRDLYFPATAVSTPRIWILDLTGFFPTPGVLQDFILPLGQRVRSGAYGAATLFVRTHDPGVVDFLRYLAKQHDLPLYVALFSPSASIATSAEPVGDLTSTEYTTLNELVRVGGITTVSQLANFLSIETTAAGNRLTRLADKCFVYRFPQGGRRNGDVFVDPRTLLKMSQRTKRDQETHGSAIPAS